MAFSHFEILTVSGDNITADLLVWRRYRMNAPGVVEFMLDQNPQLAAIHKQGPFIPPGTVVQIPIDTDILKQWPGVSAPIDLFGR
jgi:phage tail protein X